MKSRFTYENRAQEVRSSSLTSILAIQPYEVRIEELNIRVARGVFPPDFSSVSLMMARFARQCFGATALDVGTGTGLIALCLKAAGCTKVHATEIHTPALECAKTNFDSYKSQYGDISLFRCDLLPETHSDTLYDWVFFNHPLYAGSGDNTFGPGSEGGTVIITRFLTKCESIMEKGAKIVMPRVPKFGEKNDPSVIAERMGKYWKAVPECSADEEALVVIWSR